MRFAALLSFTMAAMAVSAAQTGSNSPTSFDAAANTDNLPAQARQNQYHTMPQKTAEERSGLDYPGDVPTFITLARALTDDDDMTSGDRSANLDTFRELGRRLQSQGTRVDKILGTSPSARGLLAVIQSPNEERAVAADMLPDETESESQSIASVKQQGDAPASAGVASSRRAQALGAQILKDESASQDNSAASVSANQGDMSRRAMGANVLPDNTASEHKGLASVQQESRGMGANVLPDDTASEHKGLASVQQARAVGANVLPDDTASEHKGLASVQQQSRSVGADVLPDNTASEDKGLASVQQARDFTAQAIPDNSNGEDKALFDAHQENESRDVPSLAAGAASVKGLPVLGGASTNKKVRGLAPLLKPKVLPAVKNNAIHLNKLVGVKVAGVIRGVKPLVAPKVVPAVKNNAIKADKLVSLGVVGKRGAKDPLKSTQKGLPLAKAGGGLKLAGQPVAGPIKKPLQLSLGGGPGVYQPSLTHILKGRDTIPESVDVAATKQQEAADGTSVPDASAAAAEARDVEEESTAKPKPNPKSKAAPKAKAAPKPKAKKPKTALPLVQAAGTIKVAGVPLINANKGTNVLKGSVGGSIYKPAVVKSLGLRDAEILSGKQRLPVDNDYDY